MVKMLSFKDSSSSTTPEERSAGRNSGNRRQDPVATTTQLEKKKGRKATAPSFIFDERPNIDDVSTSFSSLNITTTTTNEYSRLAAREVQVADTLQKQPGSERHFPFLPLPWLAKWRIYTHLPTKDCIALSSTCRQMYKFNTFAYTHLQFTPPNTLFSLARSISLLGEVLACSPHYVEAVRTIRIVGWNTMNIPEGWDHDVVYNALDEGIMCLLEYGRHVYSLTLDLSLTKSINYLPKTFTALTRVRTIRDVRLATFLPPTYAPESNPPLSSDPDEEPPAYERVSLSVCSGGWLPIMMRDPRKLRWFGFSIWDKGWHSGDVTWAMTLGRIAEVAAELETLVLSGGKHFDPNILGEVLQFGFTPFLWVLSFLGYALEIVVNHNGEWLRDFGPLYILELAKLVPDLEELSLDQVGMWGVVPLPGHLRAWGEAFRMFRKLRRIALASMFVLDVCDPRPVIGDDNNEEEEDGQEDAGMDLDEGDETEDEEEEEEVIPLDVKGTLASNLVYLAAWADMFLEEHLRKLAPFKEIWFLDSRFAGNYAAGYDQRVVLDEGGRAEHMICYPKKERCGWWWDESDQMLLD
ncbi:hypothetical protein B0F90DRAFT_1668851 [Multifurca ochricompacta]|uniref:F-box domain-containing protein n=1 Tax=Multifurca ochricompacta TaxID=376703 RepID=A0AAD4M1U8_9AGAM|nr:hypothetical protein B0F90DRAFT_1668851 [Multifurca ochricompacta]